MRIAIFFCMLWVYAVGGVVEITSVEQFDQELATSEVPILVEFYATWCGPCKLLNPTLIQAANSLDGKVQIFKVDVDNLGPLNERYHIQAQPTMIVIEQGQETKRRVGLEPIKQLIKTYD